ncbi:MAG: hypothetical protein K2Y29_17955 [Beijerinckiaceae bacterium]|nr:hypothetical protein [Beijerinckiaceae bacterium]
MARKKKDPAPEADVVISETLPEDAATPPEVIVDLALDTLEGDVRDGVLTLLRSLPKPWAEMSEFEQQNRIWSVKDLAKRLVRDAAHVIGSKGFDHIPITVGKFTSKDGEIKAEFATAQTHAALVKISDMQNRRSVLCFVDPDLFAGERAEAKPDKDQPELPIADAPAAAPDAEAAADAADFAWAEAHQND